MAAHEELDYITKAVMAHLDLRGETSRALFLSWLGAAQHVGAECKQVSLGVRVFAIGVLRAAMRSTPTHPLTSYVRLNSWCGERFLLAPLLLRLSSHAAAPAPRRASPHHLLVLPAPSLTPPCSLPLSLSSPLPGTLGAATSSAASPRTTRWAACRTLTSGASTSSFES